MVDDKRVDKDNSALDWVRDTILDSHSDTGLRDYERELGFKREDLEGKRVLDLGAGQTTRLARELKEAGINCEVFSLSPDLRMLQNSRVLSDIYPDPDRKAIAGIGQALPFKDETFDVVLGLNSVTYGSWAPEQVEAWVLEIGRVLVPGGEARIGPLQTEQTAIYGKDNEVIRKSAERAGLAISFQEKAPSYASFQKAA